MMIKSIKKIEEVSFETEVIGKELLGEIKGGTSVVKICGMPKPEPEPPSFGG